ncbi:MAG TPA: MOP flippase family protein [Pyrinomonadaceae bacterium]|nr:MOP flippase family protein [Pyrinomonadaceae bacterium]
MISLAQKVSKGVSWLALAQVAQRGTALVITAILARKLMPGDFGLIALTLVVVNFLAYFQDMGLSAALVQRTDVKDDHLSTTFWLNVGTGLVLAVIGSGLSPLVARIFNEPRLSKLLMVVMISMVLNGFGWTSHALLQRRLAFGQIAVVEWAATALSGLLAITLAALGAGVWALVAQNIASAFVTSCGRLLAAQWLPDLEFSIQRAKELFNFSSGVLGYSVVNHGMRNVDNIIIGAALGTTALGYYSLAYNLILMPGMTICGLVGRVMFPALSSVQNDLARFRRAYLRMARTVASITFPLILGLGATAPLFIRTVYGERWSPAIPIVQILIAVGFFEAIAFWGVAAWALGKTQMTLVFAIFSLIGMAIAFAIGVRWGLTGVSWAYVMLSPIIFLLPHFWTNRLMQLRFSVFLRAIGPPLVAAGVMATIIVAITSRGIVLSASNWMNLVGYVLLGAAVYALVLLLIAVFDPRRKRILSWLLGSEVAEEQPEGVSV